MAEWAPELNVADPAGLLRELDPVTLLGNTIIDAMWAGLKTPDEGALCGFQASGLKSDPRALHSHTCSLCSLLS